MRTQAPVRAIATGLGLLMAATTALDAHGLALVAAAATAIAVLAGVVVRPAATLAVLLAVAAIAASDAPAGLAALSGLCAALYLVLRHARDADSGLTVPTVVGAVGFTLVGVVATAFPLQLPWLPLVAPLAVVVIFTLATRPFWPRAGAKWEE